MNTLLLLSPLLLPLAVAALVLPLARSRPRLGAWITLGTVLAALLLMVGPLHAGAGTCDLPWVGDFRLTLVLTPFRALMMGFLLAFLVLNAIYLTGGIQRVARPWLHLSALHLAFASASAVVMGGNVLTLLIGWEMFLVALYGTILSGGEAAEPVALKALLIGGASDFLLILGLMLYLGLGGPLSMSGAPMATDASPATLASFVLLFLGAGAKAGMWPFQTWIPEAAECMPATGFAALPASLEKMLGVTFLWMLVKEMYVLGPLAQGCLFCFGIVTTFATVIPALVETNLKRALAYTAISPVGFMIAGLATHQALGMAGALMYMLTSATYMSAMFYAADNLEVEAGSATLEAIETRGRRLSLTLAGFAMAFLASIGFLFTGGFLAKEVILESTVHGGHYLVFLLLVVGAILNVAVMVKLLSVLFKGWSRKERGEAPLAQTLPVLTLGALSLLSGVILLWASPRLDAQLEPVVHHGMVGFYASWLIIVSLAIWIFGYVFFYGMRPPGGPRSGTFGQLRRGALLGRAFDLAEAGHFDAYVLATRAIQAVAQTVFLRGERLIDRVGGALISAGGGLSRDVLSTIHNGVYSNYLAWVLAGFALVASLVLLR
jgi:formate hydrogenlyase subunit 3/multisubunit Na+/H+ antiporter MnhD subunit